MTGLVLTATGLLWSGLLIRSGGAPGPWLYVALAVAGGGMAGAFGVLMTRVLSRVPVALAADASGVVVTVNQLGIVVGIATFGTLYLNLAGRLPAAAASAARAIGGAHGPGAFALSSGHAYLRCRSRWRGWRQSASCWLWPTSGLAGSGHVVQAAQVARRAAEG